MNKILIIFLILLFTLSGCGFKVKNQSELINFNIVEFIGNGEQRVNFRIKNKILRNLKEDNPKNIRLIINTTKEKKDKEKNLKNEITKYEIILFAEVTFVEIGTMNENSFTVKENGDFSVNKQHSQTITSEKKLVEDLSESLADEILDELIEKLNAS